MDNLKHNSFTNSLAEQIQHNKIEKILVAISGGVDSMLLLNLLSSMKSKYNLSIRAIHINHNLSGNNKDMISICVKTCKNLGIECIVENISSKTNSNIEEDLREQRYKKIFSKMEDDECLMLAHHLDDQVETFFYRLFRGSSPHGLRCMNTINKRNKKLIFRPFLNFSKKEIKDLSKYLKINFVDDLTNENINFDRNYIRKIIMPDIVKRWPSLNKVLNHNIRLLSDYSDTIDHYCDSIEKNIIFDNYLDINSLNTYPKFLHKIFLKYWLNKKIQKTLTQNDIHSIYKILQGSNNDYPEYSLNETTNLIRYDNKLFFLSSDTKPSLQPVKWDVDRDIDFGSMTISVQKLKNQGIYKSLLTRAPLIIKESSGNERIKINNSNYQLLKKLFQSNSIPIWERKKFALIFSDNNLLIAYSDNKMFISSDIR